MRDHRLLKSCLFKGRRRWSSRSRRKEQEFDCHSYPSSYRLFCGHREVSDSHHGVLVTSNKAELEIPLCSQATRKGSENDVFFLPPPPSWVVLRWHLILLPFFFRDQRSKKCTIKLEGCQTFICNGSLLTHGSLRIKATKKKKWQIKVQKFNQNCSFDFSTSLMNCNHPLSSLPSCTKIPQKYLFYLIMWNLFIKLNACIWWHLVI